MPLIVMVGHPCSGKTTRAIALQAHFTGLGHDVMIINHESLALARADMYKSNEAEKKGRATLKSTLERFLSAKKIIIFDYLNSIKGFRYEMWCRAREAQTQHVTIYCNTPVETCAEWNKAREIEAYPDAIFVDLCQRMETPNEEKRWDQPLFTLAGPESELPLDAITDVLIKGKVPTMNQAVTPIKMEDSNYLFELDRITQEIVAAIVEKQTQDSTLMVGDAFRVPHTNTPLLLLRKIHLPELRRISNQYLKIARIRTPDQIGVIATSFVDHVNMSLRQPQA